MIRRGTALVCASLLALVGLSLAASGPARLETGDRLDDASFWRMVTEFSEPGGSFQSDNLVSNERTFPEILPDLAQRRSATSAYIGVGPEQNFSYLAAVRPRIAFVVDIRRQNAMLHLLYKALFERSGDRAEFLSRLLSRDRPRGLNDGTSVSDLFAAYGAVPARRDRFASNLKDIEKRLLKAHGFRLTEEDLHGLRYVYTAFFESGPGLTYSTNSYRRGRPFPSFADLMTATDEKGVARSFLATEDNYQAVRELERRNLVVPLVGNFGGPKALKAVASYLRERGLTATVFYTSNVEMYLFRTDDWQGFYDNVAAMPRDPRSVLVRSVFGGFGYGVGSGGGAGSGSGVSPPDNSGASRLGNLQVDPMEALVAAFHRGEITAYADVVSRPR
jgi:hypothetical protein